MNRMEAMTGLINYRLSKTVTKNTPVHAIIRGVPIIIGADDEEREKKPLFGGTGSGLFGTVVFANLIDGIEQTRADIETLHGELFARVNENVGSFETEEVRKYYVNVFLPFLKDWENFDRKHHHGWAKFWDNFILSGTSTWHSLNNYRERLLDIREAAEKLMTFNAPRPAGANLDIVDETVRAGAKGAKAIWDIAKWLLIIAAVALGLTFVLYGWGKL